MKWLSLFILVFLVAACNDNPESETQKQVVTKKQVVLPAYQNFGDSATNSFNAYFKKRFNRRVFSGNILIEKGNKLYTGSFGWSNFKTREDLTLDDRFQLASVSKPLTAFAIMRLVQEGKLSLQDSIQKFILDFPYKDITIDLLLSHRSGLSNYMYITDSIWQEEIQMDLAMCSEEALQAFIETKPDAYYKPDRKFNYCNTNYFLLAAIIEEISGLDFESYMQKHVFHPLGMDDSFVYTNMKLKELENVAIGHDQRGRIMADFYLNGVPGDKGVFSTVKDLQRFNYAIDSNDWLSDSLRRLMFTPKTSLDRKGRSYAYGWRIQARRDKPPIVFHNGWWRGYRTYFIKVPAKRISIIILSNSVIGSFLNKNDLIALVEDL